MLAALMQEEQGCELSQIASNKAAGKVKEDQSQHQSRGGFMATLGKQGRQTYDTGSDDNS